MPARVVHLFSDVYTSLLYVYTQTRDLLPIGRERGGGGQRERKRERKRESIRKERRWPTNAFPLPHPPSESRTRSNLITTIITTTVTGIKLHQPCVGHIISHIIIHICHIIRGNRYQVAAASERKSINAFCSSADLHQPCVGHIISHIIIHICHTISGVVIQCPVTSHV